MRVDLSLVVLCALMVPIVSCSAQDRPELPRPANRAEVKYATTQANVGRFPFLEVDARAKQVRVECEALAVDNPLEFFCCLAGTVEHEAVLRSKVRPSHLHAGLLMLGLEPGEPVRFSESAKKWLPPHGPPLQISVQFERDGKPVTLPAYRLMRDVKNKREMAPMTWIFAGSRMRGDVYAADKTGYIVSVVNFDFTVIDIPELASNANETLHWETNPDLAPPKGAKVTMIIEPAGKVQAPPTSQPAATATATTTAPIDATLVAISADGIIEFEQQKYAGQLLPTVLRKLPRDRRVRVAVENAVEQNDVARDMINQLSRAGFDFQVIPQATAGAAPRPAPAPEPDANLTDVRADEGQIRKLREKWQQAVAPHDASLRQAATTHYDVITQLRREQQRLIDEADKIQRLIDELEKQYQDMTTPRPE